MTGKEKNMHVHIPDYFATRFNTKSCEPGCQKRVQKSLQLVLHLIVKRFPLDQITARSLLTSSSQFYHGCSSSGSPNWRRRRSLPISTSVAESMVTGSDSVRPTCTRHVQMRVWKPFCHVCEKEWSIGRFCILSGSSIGPACKCASAGTACACRRSDSVFDQSQLSSTSFPTWQKRSYFCRLHSQFEDGSKIVISAIYICMQKLLANCGLALTEDKFQCQET